MTEVPEHLLARSRARRAALGLGGGDPAPTGEGAAPPPPAAGSAAPAVAARSAAPAVAAVSPVVVEEKPVPTYLRPEAKKARIPIWIMPVLVFLPFWGILYVGAFGSRQHAAPLTGMALGQQVFRANCATCHGAAGEGGVGPKLQGGEAVKTFPDVADHISWVRTGSAPFTGKYYGDPDRDGGQHGPAKGAMPAFTSLSDAQVEAVVQYEREGL
ncbi:MAG TPA: cytochrome c [Acidimicrobiales bacterium]|nr:cytochrome c [Acidimicrobiales bacterium]